jgi:sugar phosphate isomerase/epimerase
MKKLTLILSLILTTFFWSCDQKKGNNSATVVEEPGVKKLGGLALYTVRDQMNEDPEGTLKEVSEIGYRYIEDAGYKDGKFYGMEPEAYKQVLERYELIPYSSHQSGINYDNANQIIDDLKTVGFQYLVIPIPPMGLFKVDPDTRKMGMTGGAANLTDILNTLGQQTSEAGLKLLYHNHDFELIEDEDGIVPMDYLLENTNPEDVNFELDLYWVTKAGANPNDYFNRYPGRFKAWHVKDMDDQGRFAPVGRGMIDFATILSNKEKSGMEFYFVEQDRTFDGMTPMEAIEISRQEIERIGFE